MTRWEMLLSEFLEYVEDLANGNSELVAKLVDEVAGEMLDLR